MMPETSRNHGQNDDPRKLRELIQKVSDVANTYEIGSVVVGMAGAEGDVMFPEVVDFVRSAMRVDDAIFRMTRERVVLFLADADEARAQEIMDRLLMDYAERFTPLEDPRISLTYFEVTPQTRNLSVRDVLPSIFTARPFAS